VEPLASAGTFSKKALNVKRVSGVTSPQVKFHFLSGLLVVI